MNARPPLDDAVTQRVRDHFAGIPFLRTLGVEMPVLAPGYCELHAPVRPELGQQHGYLHGGVIATLCDSASGHAALTLAPAGHGVITVEFKLSFLAPCAGERLIVRAAVLKHGRTLTVSEAHAYAAGDGGETRCASALVTYIGQPPR